MKQQNGFILMELDEFKDWLGKQNFKRTIKLIQLHHTYIPNYSHFQGNNHFGLLISIKNSHLQRGFSDIAQNITIFPDGMIAICRPFDIAPAGIKGANEYGICIENIGNFDKNGDIMTKEQKEAIIEVVALLCKKFNLDVNTNTIVYHHWYDLNTGKRTDGIGVTKSCPGTNFFGGNTVEAANKNLIPLIRQKLNTKTIPTLNRILKFGLQGDDVKLLQKQLVKLGYKIIIDGIFGVQTKQAIIDFQKKNKLIADGVVGKQTWEKLWE